LDGAALTSTQAALSNFTAVSAGGMKITVDGTAKALSDLDFSAATSLNEVASILTTALSGATVTWNPSASRFEVKSPTTGTTSKISAASAPDSGTDVSSLLGLTSTAGAKAVDGVAAEGLNDAVAIFLDKSTDWYGLSVVAASVENADLVEVGQTIEAASPARFFVATTQEAASYDPDSTTDLGAMLQAADLSHTAVQYSSTDAYAAVSLFARLATTDFNANNSTITLAFKDEPTVVAEDLTESQAKVLKAKNINVFARYKNGVSMIQWGTMTNGQYADSIIGVDWLRQEIQTDVLSLMLTSPTKLSQTDQGVNQIVTTVVGTMDKANNNGLVATGAWPYASVGPVKTGQTLTSGYFVYAGPVSAQSIADRNARKSPTIQVIALLGGAIHTVPVMVNVGE
jgi:hypothetical protein